MKLLPGYGEEQIGNDKLVNILENSLLYTNNVIKNL